MRGPRARPARSMRPHRRTKISVEDGRNMTNPSFDVAAAHKYFAGHCFNAARDLIEKKDRELLPADLHAVSAMP